MQQDQRRTFFFIFSIFFIFIYWDAFLSPGSRVPAEGNQATQQTTQAEQQAYSELQPAPAQAGTAPIAAASQQQATQSDSSAPAKITLEDIDEKGTWKIRSDIYRARISKQGAALRSFMLRKFKRELDSKQPLDLVNLGNSAELPLLALLGSESDAGVQYQLVSSSKPHSKSNESNFEVASGETLVLRFAGSLANGVQIEKVYEFQGDSYLFDVRLKLSKPLPSAARIGLLWNLVLPDAVANSRLDPFMLTFLDAENSVERIAANDETELAPRSLPTKWIGFGEKYFVSALLSPSRGALDTNFQRLAMVQKSDDQFSAPKTDYSYRFALKGSDTELHAKAYVGPKQYSQLRGLGFDLERSIDFGIFAFLAQPLVSVIHVFYEGFFGIPGLGNYGLAIILLTLAIKALFLPLTKVSMKSMKAMQDLQPEIQALRERIKDPTQLNQEMMALYKKRGVNPMGGCLPMLIQIPVFLGLYMALLNSIELRHAPFALWITDLSSPEKLELFGIGMPVMVLLMGLSMFFQQLTTPTAMDPTQKKVMMLMPVIFTIMFIVFPLPAGLVLYWLINNLISIVQQAYLRKEKDANPMKATVLASVLIFGGGYLLTLI